MRMDTEWLEVIRRTGLNRSKTDGSRHTLRIEMADEKFDFSCLPYTASEIENALHHEELPPARRTVLCIYGAVRGVGGIDSWGAMLKRRIISAQKKISTIRSIFVDGNGHGVLFQASWTEGDFYHCRQFVSA